MWEGADKPLKCSADGEDVLGSGVFATTPKHPDVPLDFWGELKTYLSTEGEFVVLHPKCFHEIVDEVLRAERSANLIIAVGKMEDLRAGLQM